jgi:hypothetical protein
VQGIPAAAFGTVLAINAVTTVQGNFILGWAPKSIACIACWDERPAPDADSPPADEGS